MLLFYFPNLSMPWAFSMLGYGNLSVFVLIWPFYKQLKGLQVFAVAFFVTIKSNFKIGQKQTNRVKYEAKTTMCVCEAGQADGDDSITYYMIGAQTRPFLILRPARGRKRRGEKGEGRHRKGEGRDMHINTQLELQKNKGGCGGDVITNA